MDKAVNILLVLPKEWGSFFIYFILKQIRLILRQGQ